MNTRLVWGSVLAGVIIAGIVAWFIFSGSSSPRPAIQNPSGGFSSGGESTSAAGGGSSGQSSGGGVPATPALPNVTQAFTAQVQSGSSITPGSAAVASGYALQHWQNSSVSGTALLKSDATTGWKLQSLGTSGSGAGSIWDISTLENAGVPTTTAQELASTTAVSQSFLAQSPFGNQIQLRGTAVSSDYALQDWTDTDQGGEGLMRYDESRGEWVLVSAGGGLWDAQSLAAAGVPQSTAADLISSIVQTQQ